jgi:PIN domain nuclease of toxin-antitoxin system
MDLLLDTHAFIWFINGDKQLPKNIQDLIKNLDNKCFISIASIWEIAIKLSIDRLSLKGGFEEIARFIEANEIEILPITFEHTGRLLKLKYHHRDPFDRIIIAQGIEEGLTVITKDENFKFYRVKVFW